jgi:hypothetical protein
MTAGARALERLYAVAPKDFTRARNTLAAELRQAHDLAPRARWRGCAGRYVFLP